MEVDAQIGSEPAHGPDRRLDDLRQIGIALEYAGEPRFHRDADLQIGTV